MENKDRPSSPFVWTNYEGETQVEPGLTKLEYFTAKSISSAERSFNDCSISAAEELLGIEKGTYKHQIHYYQCISIIAIGIATEIIKQLEK